MEFKIKLQDFKKQLKNLPKLKKKQDAAQTVPKDSEKLKQLIGEGDWYNIPINKMLTNPEDFQDPGMSEVWNSLVDRVGIRTANNVFKACDIINGVVAVDYVKDMLTTVNSQNETLKNMSISGEELSNSIREVSEIITNISTYTDNAYSNSTSSVEKINGSMEVVKDSFNDIETINEQINGFKERTKAITRIVDIVKGIAEQTNLLALNAAIEAARAGESGKGFAVVAAEVRNLAEHTQNSVLDIQKNIQALHSDIDALVAHINNTAFKLKDGYRSVEESISSVNEISRSLEEINDRVTQIAATIEEQNASTETFINGVKDLSASADNLVKSCHSTGELLYDTIRNIDIVRTGILSNALFEEGGWLDMFKTDHQLFVWKCYNAFLGYGKVPSTKADSYRACRLGKWLYSDANKDLAENNKQFQNLIKVHEELHTLAGIAANHFAEERVDDAFKVLDRVRAVLQKVLKAIDDLKASIAPKTQEAQAQNQNNQAKGGQTQSNQAKTNQAQNNQPKSN